jgi:hypothetical protein
MRWSKEAAKARRGSGRIQRASGGAPGTMAQNQATRARCWFRRKAPIIRSVRPVWSFSQWPRNSVSDFPELFHPLAHGVVLLLVPLERFVVAAAHQAFLMREMVFGAGDQAMQDFLDLEQRRTAVQRLEEFIRHAIHGPVLVVDFRDEHSVGFTPFDKTHGSFYTISDL